MIRNKSIGIFDSGLGGLSLVKELLKQLPLEEIIYFADTQRCPYGVKPLSEIRQFVFEIIEFLKKKNVKMIVIACNTATAAGLKAAREQFSIPIVGVIDPGAESAVKASRNHRIGVIATEGTIKSKAHYKAIKSLNSKVVVYGRECQKFVELVEKGKINGNEVEEIASKCLSPLIEREVDTLVLGCTHFPFLNETIKKIIGEHITIIDPSVQTVEKIKHILISKRINNTQKKTHIHQFYTTGKIDTFKKLGERLLKHPIINLKHVEVKEIAGMQSE